MKESPLRRTAAANRAPARHRNTAVRTANNDPLTTVQKQANQSPATHALDALQQRADNIAQREAVKSGAPTWAQEDYVNKVGKKGSVDTTSITQNDRVNLKTTPRTDRHGKSNDPAAGVKLWAVHEYLTGPVTLMCSMVDGKIGSIYFDGGRVRTTHSHGPTTSKHPKDKLFQYNIDRDAAFQEYITDGARDRYERQNPDTHPSRLLNWWIARRLKGADTTDVPTWAYPIETVEDALDETDTVDDEGLKLFEVMIRENGRLGHHPSRGAGVKSNLQMTRAELAMLKKAGEMFADPDNPKLANQLFYNYVKKSLPQLLPYIREPSEIS